MKAMNFFREETRKAFGWAAKLAWTFALWLFRILLRLAFLSAFLLALGGGCFALKSCQASLRPPSPVPFQNMEPWPPLMEETAYRAGSEDFQTQIRRGRSQLKSWDHTLRSLKRDIESLFRKR